MQISIRSIYMENKGTPLSRHIAKCNSQKMGKSAVGSGARTIDTFPQDAM
jgi:hypothetical protein